MKVAYASKYKVCFKNRERYRKMENVKNYILESIDEIRNKVSWPKFNELQSSAILVLVASLIFAILIGFVDLGFKNALAWFYKEL